MLEAIRLVTIHPILVHVTVGAMPLVVLAYALGMLRKSTAWTFVGDVTVVFTALVTIGTALFGLVSNASLPWPGGLGQWRWIHLLGGAASLVLLLVLAWRRWRGRAERPIADRGTLGLSVGAALVVAFTGWVGGEVLVYHAGMAVKAAGLGALSPTLDPAVGTPGSVEGAMHEARAAYAEARTQVAMMVVQRPDEEGMRRTAQAAGRLADVARWLAEGGQRSEHFTQMSREMQTQAEALRRLTRTGNLADVVRALGEVETTCAHCHQETRWKRAEEAPEAAAE